MRLRAGRANAVHCTLYLGFGVSRAACLCGRRGVIARAVEPRRPAQRFGRQQVRRRRHRRARPQHRRDGQHQGQHAVPMASTVKVAIAALYLAQVDHGRRSLDDTINGQPVRTLMRKMLIYSDNHAADILFKDVGGPNAVQEWLDDNGIKGLHVDRTIAQLLASKRDLFDRRDSATPIAMVDLLRKIYKGELIKPDSRNYLLDIMAECQTGRNRMKALLPGVPVEHKTGTLNGLADDVGFITLPDGRRVAVAIFTRGGADRPRTIAETARAIYDGFKSVFAWPFGSPATTAQH